MIRRLVWQCGDTRLLDLPTPVQRVAGDLKFDASDGVRGYVAYFDVLVEKWLIYV